MSKEKKKNVHEGHRDRMRDKFICNPNFQGFSDHEVLEILLYSAICRKDTNELAHDLINRFGSLKNVFDASYDDLFDVRNMTKNAAVLIKEIMPLARRYALAVATERGRFNSIKSVTENFGPFFSTQQSEVAYALLLNVNGDLLDNIMIGDGGPTTTDIDTTKLLQVARSSHAVRVIIMHNHPSNSVYPSEADIITTNDLMVQLAFEQIAIWDHIIFGTKNNFFSFYQNNLIHMMVNRCNNFLRQDIRGLYDKLRIPEKFSKRGVTLSETQFRDISENLEYGLEKDTKTFIKELIEYCEKEGVISYISHNSDDGSYI